MLKKQERQAFFFMVKELMRECPLVVAASITDGVIKGLRPFIAVYTMGLLIDGVYAGAATELLLSYALIATVATLVLSIADSVIVEYFNTHMEYMYEQMTGPLARKSMQMDYEYLENATVHQKREKVTGFFPRFGLMGMVLDSLTHSADVVFTMLGAFAIVIPKLFGALAEADRGIVPMLAAALFLLLLVGICMESIHFLNKSNEKMYALNDENLSPIEMRKRFFLELYAKAESQKDIRMCGQSQIIREEMQDLTDKMQELKKQSIHIVSKQSLCADGLAGLSVILVYLFVGAYAVLGFITIGSVVTVSASIRRVSEALYNLSEVISEIKEQAGYAIDYRDFMQLKQRKHEGTIPLEKRRDDKFSVEFDHVSFQYPGAEEYVIRDLSLKFTIGEKLAIVGKNGSGKTTFIKLLCRLYDVSEGCIKVNGIDIRKYDYKEYCDLFGAVFQDFQIFDFALGETLACDENVDKERALEALERAGLGERYSRLVEGLQTYIGQSFEAGGVNFSGGEKQKLAIARAIYKNAPFVIMDEPTAALDPEAETAVFEGFDKMVGHKTAIYISHRLASCKFCEDILVFDKGKVVQHGTHEELLEQKGLYQQLWNAQAQYYA